MKKFLIASAVIFAATSANAEELNTKLTYEDAKKIALEEVQKSIKVVEAEMEREEGEDWTYEVEVQAGGKEGAVVEVEIDANTGKVLEMGREDS